LITGGVFILLDCKACKNGGSRDTSDMEGIIAGGSGSILYGSARSFPLDVQTGVTAGVINLDECEDFVTIFSISNTLSHPLIISFIYIDQHTHSFTSHWSQSHVSHHASHSLTSQPTSFMTSFMTHIPYL
jgi:hypothetical protein